MFVNVNEKKTKTGVVKFILKACETYSLFSPQVFKIHKEKIGFKSIK